MEGSQTPPPGTETDAQKIERLEAELQARAEVPEAGSAAAEPAPPSPAPLAALAASVAAAKDNGENLSFVDHLKRLAEDGVKAVINPSDESDVLKVIAALVSDLAKVKL